MCRGGSVPRGSLRNDTNPNYSVTDGLFFSDLDKANDVQGRSQDAHGIWEVVGHGTQDPVDFVHGVGIRGSTGRGVTLGEVKVRKVGFGEGDSVALAVLPGKANSGSSKRPY